MPPIREGRPEDGPALRELERLCPEMGRATVRLDLRGSHFALAARYPDAKGYVALDADAIIGLLFSSVAPTQLDGELVPAAYLFGLRVHPAYRRQGVGSALITHGCERAWVETGARTVWAAVIEGNEASLRTVDRAGFARLRDLRAKILFAPLASPRHLPRLTSRPATRADLPALADAMNYYYAGHNFWRPKTPEQLRVEMEAPGHSLRDTEVALSEDGTVLAAASALEVARIARLRLLGLRALPSGANRLLAPLFGLLPLNVLLVQQYAFPPDQPAIAAALIRALQRRYLPRSWAAMVVADPLDGIWRGLDPVWGITGRIHLVEKSDRPVDQARPACLP